MYDVLFQPSFIRDLKRYAKQGGDIGRVHAVITMLRSGKELPPGLHDHQLLGKLRPLRECHVEHDRLLVYEKDGTKLRVVCLWLVTHQALRERERSM